MAADDHHFFFDQRFPHAWIPHTWFNFCRFTGRRPEPASPVYNSIGEEKAHDQRSDCENEISESLEVFNKNPIEVCAEESKEGCDNDALNGRNKDSSRSCTDSLEVCCIEREIMDQGTFNHVKEEDLINKEALSQSCKEYVKMKTVDGKKDCCLEHGCSSDLVEGQILQHYSGNNNNEEDVPLQAATLEYDVSQCYSPDEFWSCHTPTMDSPVSVSSFTSNACPSPGENHCFNNTQSFIKC